MLLDVRKLALGDKKEFDFNTELSVGGVPCSTHTSGAVIFTEEGYIVKGEIEAVLNLKCDRCLESFSKNIVCALDEVYSNDINENNEENTADAKNEDKDYRSFEDKALDIDAAVKDAVMLEMPLKALCSDDCRGLCFKCGQNLNKGECGCDRAYSNPAFEGLMDLFKD